MMRSGSWLGPGRWTTGASSRPWQWDREPKLGMLGRIRHSYACKPWGYVAPTVAAVVMRATGVRHIYLICFNIFGWSTVCPGLIITLLLVVNGNCFFESMTAVKPWNSHENENECSVQNISNINLPESHLVHWMLLWGHCEHPTSMRDPLRAQPQVVDQT